MLAVKDGIPVLDRGDLGSGVKRVFGIGVRLLWEGQRRPTRVLGNGPRDFAFEASLCGSGSVSLQVWLHGSASLRALLVDAGAQRSVAPWAKEVPWEWA